MNERELLEMAKNCGAEEFYNEPQRLAMTPLVLRRFAEALVPPQASPATVAQEDAEDDHQRQRRQVIDNLERVAACCEQDLSEPRDAEWMNKAAELLRLDLSIVAALATAQPAPQEAQPVAFELRGVAEVLAEGNGFWRSCSGCHELNEGHPTGVFSSALKCHLGLGCDECGGIGAIWDDTDYDEMAKFMAGEEDAAHQPAQEAQPVDVLQERARRLGEDWHEGVQQADKDAWCNRAAGLLLHFAAPQPARAETPINDKAHPRFIAGYNAGLHDGHLDNEKEPARAGVREHDPYLCIAPVCGDKCGQCTYAISPQDQRDYARRYAHLRALLGSKCGVFEFHGDSEPDPNGILLGGHLDSFVDAELAAMSATRGEKGNGNG